MKMIYLAKVNMQMNLYHVELRYPVLIDGERQQDAILLDEHLLWAG